MPMRPYNILSSHGHCRKQCQYEEFFPSQLESTLFSFFSPNPNRLQGGNADSSAQLYNIEGRLQSFHRRNQRETIRSGFPPPKPIVAKLLSECYILLRIFFMMKLHLDTVELPVIVHLSAVSNCSVAAALFYHRPSYKSLCLGIAL